MTGRGTMVDEAISAAAIASALTILVSVLCATSGQWMAAAIIAWAYIGVAAVIATLIMAWRHDPGS